MILRQVEYTATNGTGWFFELDEDETIEDMVFKFRLGHWRQDMKGDWVNPAHIVKLRL